MTKIKAKEDGNKFSIGTNKDSYNTFYWYQKAAENDDDDAQFNIALLYEKGKGTEKNLEEEQINRSPLINN